MHIPIAQVMTAVVHGGSEGSVCRDASHSTIYCSKTSEARRNLSTCDVNVKLTCCGLRVRTFLYACDRCSLPTGQDGTIFCSNCSKHSSFTYASEKCTGFYKKCSYCLQTGQVPGYVGREHCSHWFYDSTPHCIHGNIGQHTVST